MDSTVSRRAFVTGAAACAGTACLGAAGATWAIASEQPAASTSAQPQSQTPRYVFLFIGDGMSYPQVQATAYYRGALATAGAEPAIERLSFMDFRLWVPSAPTTAPRCAPTPPPRPRP